jgi:valyl-tRNA synthetase
MAKKRCGSLVPTTQGLRHRSSTKKSSKKKGVRVLICSPEELYKEILDFTLSNKSFMEGQLRQLGASCDWSREVFTLDERVVKTVYSTFQKLNDDGLLYRGSRIVNWCPKHQTSLSNLETERETRTDKFYYLKYGPFTIAPPVLKPSLATSTL